MSWVGRGILGLALVLAAVLAVRADDPVPEAPKDAKGYLQKAVKATVSQEGYHFSLKSSSQAAAAAGGMAGGKGGGGPSGLDSKGISRKTGVVNLTDGGIGEIWMKGRKVLVKQNGQNEWKVPESLGPAGAAITRLLRTPNDIAEDMVRLAGSAKNDGEEKIEEIDCWVVGTVGDKAAIDAYVKQLRERAGGLATMFLGAAQFDTDKAELTYKAWIGKSDGFLYRIENKANVPLKGGGNPLLGGGGGVDQSTTVDYLAYNTDLNTEVPAEVKRKLGIK